jgi:hypothetical protein
MLDGRSGSIVGKWCLRRCRLSYSFGTCGRRVGIDVDSLWRQTVAGHLLTEDGDGIPGMRMA